MGIEYSAWLRAESNLHKDTNPELTGVGDIGAEPVLSWTNSKVANAEMLDVLLPLESKEPQNYRIVTLYNTNEFQARP